VTVAYFDKWYTDIDRSASRQRLAALGLGLPEEVSPSSMVPVDGLREIAGWLGLSPGTVLVARYSQPDPSSPGHCRGSITDRVS
jgi:hypothetical protein